MHFNSLVKLTSLLSLVSVAYCGSSRVTFYGLNNNRPSVTAPPSCGIDGVDLKTEYYIALNKDEYIPSQVKSDNPNTATVCNKCVKVVYKNKWVVGRIIDKCPGCPKGGLDVSPTLFEKLEPNLDTGVIYVDWEYTDCSLLGKSSSCSGGKCTSSHQKEESKATVKKTNTKKTTTSRRTTNARTTVKTTRAVKPISTVPNKSVASNKPINTKTVVQPINNTTGASKTLPNNINTKNPTNNKGTNTKNPVVPLNGQSNINTNSTRNATPVKTKQSGSSANTIVNEEKEGSNYALPITGAIVVTGAAGIALLYVKRDSNNINNLKEKFPEAFNNIKRSISRGSTNLRRSLSNSSLALKRSLSKKSNNQNEQYDTTGPHIRTKKEYRDSLDAHYPVQLYDPPVSGTYQPFSNGYDNSQPTYQLQNFNINGYDNDDMRIDFHNSHY